MKHSIDAIYENGAFRPVQPGEVAITDGQAVRITIEDEPDPPALRLAMNVYDGLSDEEIEEVERISRCRENFFGAGGCE